MLLAGYLGEAAVARSRAAVLVPKADAWHHWFYACRDPARTGLVAIIHPWESGRDNSVDWDEALAREHTKVEIVSVLMAVRSVIAAPDEESARAAAGSAADLIMKING